MSDHLKHARPNNLKYYWHF